MANARLVTVADMLDARDQRAERQKRLLKASSLLICLTMNIPGPGKTSPEILAAFREGVRRVRGAVGTRPILYEAFTGPEAYFPLNADAEDVKRQMCHIEDEEPLGRLYDLDVLSADSENAAARRWDFRRAAAFCAGSLRLNARAAGRIPFRSYPRRFPGELTNGSGVHCRNESPKPP